MNLHFYKLVPSEPIHDLKGHFANLIDEIVHFAQGEALREIKKVQATIVAKETLYASDIERQLS